MDLVTARDLEIWADRLEPRGELPRLIRRLISSTGRGLTLLSMRAGEGVGVAGWDGVVSAETGDDKVPAGLSVWELGTGKNPKSKANQDYRKRTGDPGEIDPAEAVFVFVTLRRWHAKDDWAREKREAGPWKDVRAYDVDDVEGWLERSPVVHAWISERIGNVSSEAEALETWWSSWSGVTKPPLPPAILLSGRDAILQKVERFLAGEPGAVAICGDSQEEVVAFIAALFESEALIKGRRDFGRALVVHSRKAWRRLAVADQPLLLLPLFEQADMALATEHGHHVLLPLGREQAQMGSIELPRLRRTGIEAALLEAGFSRDRAAKLATVGRRSLLALRRELSHVPEVQRPKWAQPEHARAVLPALLAGQWEDENEGDREAISQLGGKPYEQIVEELTRWAESSDPPVRRVGQTWLIAAKHHAWRLTARFITSEDLQRFRQVVLEVVGGDDPKLDLPLEEQHMAALRGKQRLHSELLTTGLADTVAMVAGVAGERPLASGRTGQDEADFIVYKLLEAANEDRSGRRWISLAPSLPPLAESAPDVFLVACEKELQGAQSPLTKLFQDGSSYSGSAHTYLLSALEALAWPTQYLGRVALILAELAKRNPGGKLYNRPAASSLASILLLWRRGTSASLTERLQVVDAIRKSHPDVAWGLALSLIGTGHGIANPARRPRWRDWMSESEEELTSAARAQCSDALIERALADVGTSGQRWMALLERTARLWPTARQMVIEKLEQLEPKLLAEEDRATLSDGLRDLVSRHQRHAKQWWAMPLTDADRLSELIPSLAPETPALRYSWLFGNPWSPRASETYQESRQSQLAAQVAAVTEIYESEGLDGILRWGEENETKSVQEIGSALATIALDQVVDDRMARELISDSKGRRLVAAGYVGKRYPAATIVSWAEGQLRANSHWRSEDQARFLASLPQSHNLWAVVEQLGADVDRNFWQQVVPLFDFLPDRATATLQAAKKLLSHDRPYAVVQLLADHAEAIPGGPPCDLLAEALEMAASATLPEGHLDHFSSVVRTHIERLQQAEFDPARLARLEWMYLPLFPTEPELFTTLHATLSEEPSRFVELVSLVYRAEGDSKRSLSEKELGRAQVAFSLLELFRWLPGNHPEVGSEALKEWVQAVRRKLEEEGRQVIGDICLGKALAHGPASPDDDWPILPVRELLEEIASPDLESGFEMGVRNMRGIWSKSLLEGGDQERALAQLYRSFADQYRLTWPRTAAVLDRLADSYEREARHSDKEAELTEDQWS